MGRAPSLHLMEYDTSRSIGESGSKSIETSSVFPLRTVSRLAEMNAEAQGVSYEPGDPEWEIAHALEAAAGQDPDVMRAFLSIASVIALPDEVIARPGVLDKAIELGSGWRDVPLPGPDRERLLAAIAA